MAFTYRSKPLPPFPGSPFHAKAIREPSGENAGEVSSPGSAVNGTAVKAAWSCGGCLPMPSRGNYSHKAKDQNGENACADLQPRLTKLRRVNRFDSNDWSLGLCRWFQRTDEPIAPARQGLHIARALRRVAEHLPDLVNGRVEVALDIHKRVRPETLLQLFPRDHVARPLQQDGEYLEGLPAELQLHAILAQLARLHVCFEMLRSVQAGDGIVFQPLGKLPCGSRRALLFVPHLTPYLFNFNNRQQLCRSTSFPYFIDMDSTANPLR